MADWADHQGPIEREPSRPDRGEAPAAPPRDVLPASPRNAIRRPIRSAILEAFDRRTTGQLLVIWLSMIAVCALAYWLAGFSSAHALWEGGRFVEPNWRGLASAMYFSFVTATSVGYGDIVPRGLGRVLAIAEAAAGLLIFGAVVSKFVSRRQEQVIGEIHWIAFEDRLDRVRTNLHLVLSELQAIAALTRDRASRPDQLLARIESATLVFSGELRTVHDLLYRPQQAPEDVALEAILASLTAALRELSDLLGGLRERSPILESHLRSTARLASEICGDCVPRESAPALVVWMNRIQALAQQIV